jgi:hypothetical protein
MDVTALSQFGGHHITQLHEDVPDLDVRQCGKYSREEH